MASSSSDNESTISEEPPVSDEPDMVETALRALRAQFSSAPEADDTASGDDAET